MQSIPRVVTALAIWVLGLVLFIYVTKYVFSDASWSWKLAVVLWIITLAFTIDKFYVVVGGNKVVTTEEQISGDFFVYPQGFHFLFPTETVYKTVDLEKDVKTIPHSAKYMSNNGAGIDVDVTIVCRPLWGNRPPGDPKGQHHKPDVIKYIGHKDGVIETMIKAKVSREISSTFGTLRAEQIIKDQAALKATLANMFSGLNLDKFEEDAGIWIGEITVTKIELDDDAKKAELEKLKGQALAVIITDLKAQKLNVSDEEIVRMAERQLKNRTTEDFNVNVAASGLEQLAHFSLGAGHLPFGKGGKGGGGKGAPAGGKGGTP